MTAFHFGTMFRHFTYPGENTYNCQKMFELYYFNQMNERYLGYLCCTPTSFRNILSNSISSGYNPRQIEKETVTVIWTIQMADRKRHRKEVLYFICLDFSSNVKNRSWYDANEKAWYFSSENWGKYVTRFELPQLKVAWIKSSMCL